MTASATKEKQQAVQGRTTVSHLFWILIIAAFLGAVAETIFMLVTRGQLMNRSGVLYGQFSLVWGVGAVLFTVLLHGVANRGKVVIFFTGALIGTGFEFICSWLQEDWFGLVFWDYSHLPFSIGGRVNLVFSLFWGLAAVLWMTALLPRLQTLVDRIPARTYRPLTRALILFMAVNVMLSAAALARLNERQQGMPPANVVEVFLDQYFPDNRLFERFTNMQYIK